MYCGASGNSRSAPPLPPEPPKRRIGFHVEPEDKPGSKAKKKA